MKRLWLVILLVLAMAGAAWGQGSVTRAPIPWSYLDTDANLAADSDAKVASQKAIKTYADAIIAGGLPTQTGNNRKSIITDGSAASWNFPGHVIVVAASNALASVKATANYLCTGTADDVTIASAITAATATKTPVVLSSGTFTLAAGITVPQDVILLGAGNGATILDASGANAAINVITIAANAYYSQVKDLAIVMPASFSGSGILGGANAHLFKISGVKITNASGAGTGWAINLANCYQFGLQDILIDVYSNGIAMLESSDDFNTGDGYLHGYNISLRAANTIGLKISGSTASNSIINNLVLTNGSISTNVATVNGITGVLIQNAVRLAFTGLDVENIDTGVNLLSRQGSSVADVTDVNFINYYPLTVATPWTSTGSTPLCAWIGGNATYNTYSQKDYSIHTDGNLLLTGTKFAFGGVATGEFAQFYGNLYSTGKIKTVAGTSEFWGGGSASVGWGDTSTVGYLSFSSTAAIIRAISAKGLDFQVNGSTSVMKIQPNGVVNLVALTGAPSGPAVGDIARADRTNWDPLSKGSGGSYFVWYNGSAWVSLTSQ